MNSCELALGTVQVDAFIVAVLNMKLVFTAEYVLPCNRSDPNINACIKRGFTHLRPYIAEGKQY